MTRVRFASMLSAVFLVTSFARAQDHEKCYKIKDPVKLSGKVDINSPQFGLDAGCLISAAKYFCVPASKTVTSANDKATGSPITPLAVFSQPAPGDRICYKIKCPAGVIADQTVTDQFGTRLFPGAKFKASFLCTPAVKGASFCGDGVIDAGEACDGAATGSCPGTCESDCTCTCPTVCCYVENLAVPPDAQCFEYTGTPAQAFAFMTSCTNGVPPPAVGVPGSLPFGAMANSNVGVTLVPGPCAASPLFGTPCVLGPPLAGNLHVIPADSSCP